MRSVSAALVGNVSLGVHAVESLEPSLVARNLVDQAKAAERAGFDGVTVSEHHGDFPGYVPQPLQVASWILESTDHVWSGPGPLLLGMRRASLVAEELAWLHARHPGRVVAGLAPGYAQTDFDLVGAPFHDRLQTMRDGLRELLAALHGSSALQADPAVAAAVGQIPLLAASSVPHTAQRAARAGVGMLLPGALTADRAAVLANAYRDADGAGPVVGILRVWIGCMPSDDGAMVRRMQQAGAPGAEAPAFRAGPVHGSPAEVADGVAVFCRESGIDAINLRVHTGGADAPAVLEQIEVVGQHVLPAARSVLAPRGHRVVGASGARPREQSSTGQPPKGEGRP